MSSSRKQDIELGEDDDVLVAVSTSGAAYLLPSSTRRLPVATRRLLHELADLGGQIRHLEDHIEQRVPALRRAGASWAQIGAAIGMTGEGARSAYRDLVDDV